MIKGRINCRCIKVVRGNCGTFGKGGAYVAGGKVTQKRNHLSDYEETQKVIEKQMWVPDIPIDSSRRLHQRNQIC